MVSKKLKFFAIISGFLQTDSFDEDNLEHDGDGRWPFHSFVEQLILDMFDPGRYFFCAARFEYFSVLTRFSHATYILYAIKLFQFLACLLDSIYLIVNVSLGDSSWQCYGFEGDSNPSWCLCWGIYA